MYPYHDKYEIVTCSYAGICPDGVAKMTCIWLRYFAVQCLNTNPVRISVFTNSLPTHCYYTDVLYPIGSQTTYNFASFEVDFNLPTLNMAKASGLNSNDVFVNTLIVD